MIRWGLFGGTWPPTPWQVFVVVGLAALGAGLVFPVLFPYWSRYPELGAVELVLFIGLGLAMLMAGVVRRRGRP